MSDVYDLWQGGFMQTGRIPRVGRNAAIRLARKMKQVDGVVFDTETTGLDAQAEIVEVAVVGTDGTPLLQTLVNPTCPIPQEASAIHGIFDHDVRDAPTIVELLPQLRKLFGGKYVFAYNFAYDHRLLMQSVRARESQCPREWTAWAGDRITRHCIMVCYAVYWGDWSDYHGSYTWQKLTESVDNSGIYLQGTPHRALWDATASAALLDYMATQPEC